MSSAASFGRLGLAMSIPLPVARPLLTSCLGGQPQGQTTEEMGRNPKQTIWSTLIGRTRPLPCATSGSQRVISAMRLGGKEGEALHVGLGRDCDIYNGSCGGVHTRHVWRMISARRGQTQGPRADPRRARGRGGWGGRGPPAMASPSDHRPHCARVCDVPSPLPRPPECGPLRERPPCPPSGRARNRQNARYICADGVGHASTTDPSGFNDRKRSGQMWGFARSSQGQCPHGHAEPNGPPDDAAYEARSPRVRDHRASGRRVAAPHSPVRLPPRPCLAGTNAGALIRVLPGARASGAHCIGAHPHRQAPPPPPNASFVFASVASRGGW